MSKCVMDIYYCVKSRIFNVHFIKVNVHFKKIKMDIYNFMSQNVNNN